MYREYKPNILLAPYIETYWATDESLSGKQTLRILPDGGINVLFNLAENEVDIIKPFIPYIIGTKTTFSNVVHERADRMIGVRFRPCAISAYTKVPVYEFNNCRVDTSLFLSLFADFNSERLAEKEDEIERLNYIEEYLLGKLNCLNNIDKQFIYVAEYIRMTNGMVPVNELLDKVYPFHAHHHSAVHAELDAERLAAGDEHGRVDLLDFHLLDGNDAEDVQ